MIIFELILTTFKVAGVVAKIALSLKSYHRKQI